MATRGLRFFSCCSTTPWTFQSSWWSCTQTAKMPFLPEMALLMIVLIAFSGATTLVDDSQAFQTCSTSIQERKRGTSDIKFGFCFRAIYKTSRVAITLPGTSRDLFDWFGFFHECFSAGSCECLTHFTRYHWLPHLYRTQQDFCSSCWKLTNQAVWWWNGSGTDWCHVKWWFFFFWSFFSWVVGIPQL